MENILIINNEIYNFVKTILSAVNKEWDFRYSEKWEIHDCIKEVLAKLDASERIKAIKQLLILIKQGTYFIIIIPQRGMEDYYYHFHSHYQKKKMNLIYSSTNLNHFHLYFYQNFFSFLSSSPLTLYQRDHY